jgi:hypothetical protein
VSIQNFAKKGAVWKQRPEKPFIRINASTFAFHRGTWKSCKSGPVMEGVPYQTLIASTPHKFVTGKLKEAV